MAAAKKTLYEILGVARDANDIDIGLAHERRTLELAREVPPDPSARSLAHEAFEVLSNPKRRAAYDASLVSAAEKAAAAQQASPDLVLDVDEDEERSERRKKLMVPVGIGVAIALGVLLFVLRPRPAPAPVQPVAEAPQPPPPPAPPKPRSAPEILADAVTSAGKIMSYEMSGRAVPVGLAMGTEAGVMITTCHALPAGAKLVVQVGAESLAADLAITDEDLDLCKLAVGGFTTRPFALATDDAKAGDRIYAVGMNAKGEMALTEGKVTEVRTVPAGTILLVSMPIAPAGSGGPVFNEFGRVVGVATTPHWYGAGLNVALPVSWIAQMRSRGRAQ